MTKERRKTSISNFISFLPKLRGLLELASPPPIVQECCSPAGGVKKSFLRYILIPSLSLSYTLSHHPSLNFYPLPLSSTLSTHTLPPSLSLSLLTHFHIMSLPLYLLPPSFPTTLSLSLFTDISDRYFLFFFHLTFSSIEKNRDSLQVNVLVLIALPSEIGDCYPSVDTACVWQSSYFWSRCHK